MKKTVIIYDKTNKNSLSNKHKAKKENPRALIIEVSNKNAVEKAKKDATTIIDYTSKKEVVKKEVAKKPTEKAVKINKPVDSKKKTTKAPKPVKINKPVDSKKKATKKKVVKTSKVVKKNKTTAKKKATKKKTSKKKTSKK